jgi:hypothetical protein
MSQLELRLPEDVLEHLPREKEALIAAIRPHADERIRIYERHLARRAGTLGDPLDKRELSLLRDFLVDWLLENQLHLYDKGGDLELEEPQQSVGGT